MKEFLKKAIRKVLKWTLILLAVALVATVVAIPFALPPIVEKIVSEKISEQGFTPDVHMDLRYCWRNGPGVRGRLQVAVAGAPWLVRADFGASCSEYEASVQMNETAFDETDPVLGAFTRKIPRDTVSNLTFSGKIALDAHVRRTFSMPVPVWDVKVPIHNVNAHFFNEESEITLNDLTLAPVASGITTNVTIRPVFIRAASLVKDTVTFSNLFAAVHASERALLVTEANAGFCGGQVTLYSLFLDMKSLNSGFTLFADNIDAGQVLRDANGFKGEATGKLHGKIRLFMREGGKTIRLSEAYLYSTPGEIGKIKLEDPKGFTENLAYAGLDETTRNNVASALTDLDYSVLKMSLKRTGDRDATLTTHVSGTASRGSLNVPVDLTVNLRGEIEQLLNLSLDYSKKMKGMKP